MSQWSSKKRAKLDDPVYLAAKKKAKEDSNQLAIYHFKPTGIPEGNGNKPMEGCLLKLEGYWEKAMADAVVDRIGCAKFLHDTNLVPYVFYWYVNDQKELRPANYMGKRYPYRTFAFIWEEGIPEFTKESLEDWATNTLIPGLLKTGHGATIEGIPRLADDWYFPKTHWSEHLNMESLSKLLYHMDHPNFTPFTYFKRKVGGKGWIYSLWPVGSVPFDVIKKYGLTKENLEDADFERYTAYRANSLGASFTPTSSTSGTPMSLTSATTTSTITEMGTPPVNVRRDLGSDLSKEASNEDGGK